MTTPNPIGARTTDYELLEYTPLIQEPEPRGHRSPDQHQLSPDPQRALGRASRYFHYAIASDLTAVDAVCDEARRLLRCEGQTDCMFCLDLLLREFLNNAIVHGNRFDSCKKAEVDVRIGRRWIALRITDEGRGFDWAAMSRAPPDENATSGRGLAIGAQYAQRMRFNQVGNQVTLWIRKTDGKGKTT